MMQLTPEGALTLTIPVGVPGAGGTAATLTDTVPAAEWLTVIPQEPVAPWVTRSQLATPSGVVKVTRPVGPIGATEVSLTVIVATAGCPMRTGGTLTTVLVERLRTTSGGTPPPEL